MQTRSYVSDWQTVSLVCFLMDNNINFESSNASQGSPLQSQQEVNMIHFNESSPWTIETLSGFTQYDCTTDQSFPVQCSSSKPYSLSFHQSSDSPSLDQSQPMVPIQPLQDQNLKPLYQGSCANDFAATNASSGSYSLSFEASKDPQVCQKNLLNFFLRLLFFVYNFSL